MADAKKITFKSVDEMVGRTFHIPEAQALLGENFGPLVGEITENNVLLLKSLNKSNEALKVGYVVLGRALERFEASYGYIAPPKDSRQKKGTFGWTNFEPGCHPTQITLGHLMTCKVELQIHDLNDCEVGPTKRSPYEAPKFTQPRSGGKATPPPTGVDDGWVMI